MKILHIIPDDKFWRSVIQLFDMTDYDNEYVSIVNDDCQQFEYITTERIKLIHEKEASFVWNRLDVDVFMFHSIPEKFYDNVLAIPQNKIIIASSWGYDIYYPQGICPPLVSLDLYREKTLKLLTDMNKVPCVKRIKKSIKHILFHKKYKKISAQHEIEQKQSIIKQRKVLDKIDYWATVLPIEYELLKSNLHFRAQYFPFQYTSRRIETILNTIDTAKADYILLGNSSDPSNNHLDLMKLLKDRGITNKLYIPLAYGNKRYRDFVKQYVASNSLDCIIQEDMMPFELYKEKLLRCRVGVFGHIRQQAIGNVSQCMLLGCKVFLYKDSVAYKYFKSIGCVVFNIENDLTDQSISIPLTSGEIELNRKKLEIFTIDSVLPKMNAVLQKMEEF